MLTRQMYAKVDLSSAVAIWLFDEGKGDEEEKIGPLYLEDEVKMICSDLIPDIIVVCI